MLRRALYRWIHSIPNDTQLAVVVGGAEPAQVELISFKSNFNSIKIKFLKKKLTTGAALDACNGR
jgi:hypothetical protein